MTSFYDKGLLRAMKRAYKDSGYQVAVTDTTVIIQTAFWGVEIQRPLVPYSVKSLITLHNGGMPATGQAVCVQKGECASLIMESVIATFYDLASGYTQTGGTPIKPTKLTMGGQQVWQATKNLGVKLVDLDDMQILLGDRWDMRLIAGFLYGRSWYGAAYIRPQMVVHEDQVFVDHLAQVQWIPVELE